MASITRMSNSNYVSSLYNSSKTISGLASGLDTESMIESLTQSYQAKITQIQQKSTKVEWKQEAYRSMISKMYSYSNKYTSYTSSSNLLSQAFWSSAKTSSVSGTNSGKVSASGTTSSDVVLNSVSQLAASARLATTGNFPAAGDGLSIQGKAIDLTGSTEVNALQGSLTLTYGNKTVSVNFGEGDKLEAQKKADGSWESADEVLARVINEKLGDETIALSSGSSVAANERINVSVKDGVISFSDSSGAGNSVYISGGSGQFERFVPDKPNDAMVSSFTVPDGTTRTDEASGQPRYFRTDNENTDKISGTTLNINLDGTTKQIKMPTIKKNDDGTYTVGEKNVAAGDLASAVTEELNNAIQKEFGNKIEVKNKATDGTLQLEFSLKDEGSNLLINTDAGDALGIGKVASNYLSTGKTLEDLGVKFNPDDEILDENGNGTGKYEFKINNVKIGEYDKNTTLATIMSDINSKSDVNVSYSKTSREFVFTSKDTGEHTEVKFGGLAKEMFGASDDFAGNYGLRFGDGEQKKQVTFSFGDGTPLDKIWIGKDESLENVAKRLNSSASPMGYKVSYNEDSGQITVTDKQGNAVDLKVSADGKEMESKSSYTAGQDAKFTVTVNGKKMDMTRSSNKAEIDGLTINFKGTFATGADDEPVTFQTNIKADKVVDEVKNMFAELNVLLSEARGHYATMPAQKSSGATYDPLTDDDMSGMSESAIKNYEEKAKQGLLFADSNISGLYNSLVNIFNTTGADRTMMEKMGIGISYDSNSAATITLDENKFREALENDFDGVVDMFTRSKESGAASDGIMQSIKTQMDRYGATTGAVKGILVQQAGTPLASLTLLDNGWQKEIDNYASQIEKWQEKLEKQVDRYTKLFSRLETLTNQMNSQSSALAGLMGG